MNLIFKWLNNFLFTSNIRPESSSYRFTDSKKKWGKYMSPNFINGLLLEMVNIGI